jgi:hypothetical protein
LFVATLVAAGCGDDTAEDASPTTVAPTVPSEEGDTDPATSTTAAAELTDSFRGVTADTIKLGVAYMDLEAVAALIDLDYGDFELTYGAIIDDINANGGVLGRQIEPVFAPYLPIGSASMEEGCTRLALDEQVFATVGPVLSDGPLCYTELHDTAFVGSAHTHDRIERSAAPWFATVTDLDDAAEIVVRGLAQQGLYDNATVAVVGNSADEIQLDQVVLPVLDELGVDVVESAIITSALGDSLNSDPEVGLIAERFRAEGADTVIVLANGSLQWIDGLVPTAYRPTSAFIDLQGVRAYLGDESGRDLSVLAGSVAGAHNQWHRWLDDPKLQDCVAVVEAATGTTIVDPTTAGPGDPDNIASVQWACAELGLFVAIAEAAGADLTNDSFRNAGEQLGTFTIPGFGDGFYGPDSPDGDPPIYFWTWDPDAGHHVTDDTVFS